MRSITLLTCVVAAAALAAPSAAHAAKTWSCTYTDIRLTFPQLPVQQVLGGGVASANGPIHCAYADDAGGRAVATGTFSANATFSNIICGSMTMPMGASVTFADPNVPDIPFVPLNGVFVNFAGEILAPSGAYTGGGPDGWTHRVLDGGGDCVTRNVTSGTLFGQLELVA
jgi:hypothetical protein